MNELRSALQDYLMVRRALGYKLKETERLLGQFVAYCEESGISVVTTDVAVTWATLPAGADISWWAQRLSKVRCFATWLQTHDPAATEVPPTDILIGRPRRAVPYLYTDDEVAAIMAAASRLRSPLQQHTYQALVGLLAVAGLRVGEGIRLNRDDVCLDSGVVRVIRSKRAERAIVCFLTQRRWTLCWQAPTGRAGPAGATMPSSSSQSRPGSASLS